MTKERKILIAVAGCCMAGIIGCLVGAAFMLKTRYCAPLMVGAGLCWWLGSSIAEVLKQSKGRK